MGGIQLVADDNKYVPFPFHSFQSIATQLSLYHPFFFFFFCTHHPLTDTHTHLTTHHSGSELAEKMIEDFGEGANQVAEAVGEANAPEVGPRPYYNPISLDRNSGVLGGRHFE